MTTIVTRSGKGSPLTHTEVDTNFTNLNTNKLEAGAIALGSAATPSISFTGDTNTGIYSPGADTLAFVTAGSNRVHITSGGLVGIGTSAPSVRLQVQNSIAGGSGGTIATLHNFSDTGGDTRYSGLNFVIGSDNGTSAIRAARTLSAVDYRTDLSFWTNPTGATQTPVRAMTIDYLQRVGIGTSAPGQLLQVGGFSGSNGITVGAGSSNYSFIYFADGTAGTEAYRGYLQYNHATDQLELGSAGLRAVTVDSLQRVGIGSTAPATQFAVQNASTSLGIEVDTTSGFASGPTVRGYYRAGSAYTTLGLTGSQVAFGINDVEKARLDASGRLLVGTSTSLGFAAGQAVQKLQVAGATDGGLTIGSFGADAFASNIDFLKSRSSTVGVNTIVQNNDAIGKIYFSGADGSAYRPAVTIESFVDGTPGANDMPGRLVFSTTPSGSASPTERMRITNLGVLKQSTTGAYVASTARYNEFSNFNGTSGDTNTVFALGANTDNTSSYFLVCFQSGVGNKMVVYGNGNIQNVNNSYGALSDIKLKENIVNATSQWSDIKALQVRKYNFKEGQTHTQIGLVAQEVELVSPGLVSESPDRDPEGNDLGTVTKSVNYSVLYMKAVKALQEAMERIESLEAKVTALESA